MDKPFCVSRKIVKVWPVIILTIVCGMLFSSCEPLRKKFMRKKKENKSSEIIPVLEPIDYPVLMETVSGQYKYHYSMWQVWVRDCLTAIMDDASNKRIAYILRQMVKELTEMRALLSPDKKKIADDVLSQVNVVLAKYAKGLPVFKTFQSHKRILRIEKKVRNELGYNALKEYLSLLDGR